ncbi:MAG TPA: 2-hydroxymuconate tautomerase [Kofleriaceae bacterium]|jgi:4-oxalocrotonate tautomerase|nr:2-hydroxymuconate tautomerase [Kofleriaceae bacterium]
MPFVEITLIEGRTTDQKRKLFESITRAVAEHAEVAPEAVRIVLREVPAAHWAVGGVPKG